MAKQLICPNCGDPVGYMVVRAMFTVKDGVGSYETPDTLQYKIHLCPSCMAPLASDGKRATERLTEGK